MKALTKKWRKEQVRAVIDRNKISVPFDGSDVSIFSDLCQKKMDSACRHINPQYPSDPRYVKILLDGKWDGFGWNKAIDQPADPAFEMKRVMRHLVADDMREFMDSVKQKECATCKATDNLSVDHVYPAFVEMANYFIQLHGIAVIIDSPDKSKVVKMFADPDMEAAWVSFHAQHAVYQILCRSCNSRKGAKNV